MSNAQFIADHRQRHARVDVSRTTVAHVTGLEEDRLDELKPSEWRFEHDWRILGGDVYYARAALPLLVGVLSTSGEPGAASKLISFLAGDSDDPRRPSAACLTLSHAAAKMAPRKSFLNEWEEKYS